MDFSMNTEQKYSVEWSYTYNWTDSQHSTFWFTFKVGETTFKKRATMWHSAASSLWCRDKDVWGCVNSLMYPILHNKTYTVNGLKRTLDDSGLFERRAEGWFRTNKFSEKMRDFLWTWEYTSSQDKDGIKGYKRLEKAYEAKDFEMIING